MPMIAMISRTALLTAALLSQAPLAAETFGRCRFATQTQAFAGNPKVQAACLLRKVRILGNVEDAPAVLPPNLSRLVGQSVTIDKSKLRAFILSVGLSEEGLGGSLYAPLSRGSANDPRALFARYFVIHDTSSPNFGSRPFPADIDTSNQVNGFAGYRSATNAKAHIFLNRRGEIYVGHGFGAPWRATKLEIRAGVVSKGLFLHIENIQPRRAHPNQADGNAPDPGLTAIQYDRLALLYVVASARAGQWLIPAFHAAIDQGFSDGHDDPQNFSLRAFDDALGRVLVGLA